MDIVSIIIYITFIPLAYGLWLPFFASFGASLSEDRSMAAFLALFGPLSIVAYALCLLLSGKKPTGFKLW